jgi:hypothetical protein
MIEYSACIRVRGQHVLTFYLNAYALHILGQQHEYGPINDTVKLIKRANKDRHMNYLGNVNIRTSEFRTKCFCTYPAV